VAVAIAVAVGGRDGDRVPACAIVTIASALLGTPPSQSAALDQSPLMPDFQE
jgi:hypothetical protein